MRSFLFFAAAACGASARNDTQIIAEVRAAQGRLRDNIRTQNWLGIADYSPTDRVEVGVNADGSAMGGFKGGAVEAAVFANLIGATVPRTPPGAYQWHDDTFAAHVESDRVVHVVGYGHASGDIACSLFHLPDHKGFSTYTRYRLDLDGRWRIQITLFPIGDAAAQFKMSGGQPPSRACPSPPRSPLLGNAPLLPGTAGLMEAVRPTSDEQAGFSQTTGFGVGTKEQSTEALRAAAKRALSLSDALRNGSAHSEALTRFFSDSAAIVPDTADRFIDVYELIESGAAARASPMNSTWAFDEQDGVVHEVGLGGIAASYYTRWELQGGRWLVTVHVYPVGPPPQPASAASLASEAEHFAEPAEPWIQWSWVPTLVLMAALAWALVKQRQHSHSDFVPLEV